MQDSGSTTRLPRADQQLRLLLACPTCELQFDAGAREPGSNFHCGCGTLITVPQVTIREDSAVIRCSSCGAPKRTGGQLCPFCSAKFTLHERDLKTICPNCVSRISSRARYCHHCGISIIPNRLKESATSFQCPCCADHSLNSRQLGEDQVTVLECSCCGGLWLGHEVFTLLQKNARTQEIPWAGRSEEGIAKPPSRTEGPLYRNCCICHKYMSRRNFAQHSGVIVDICAKHGIWFDQGELEQILRKISSGELSQSSRKAQARRREREILKRVRREGGPLDRAGAEEFGNNRGEGPAPDFIRGVISFLLEG